eukprot:6842720-Alexandrium_andersonii.AAC.1
MAVVAVGQLEVGGERLARRCLARGRGGPRHCPAERTGVRSYEQGCRHGRWGSALPHAPVCRVAGGRWRRPCCH